MTNLLRHRWQSPNSAHRSSAGYTLIEVLVVVAIVGILAAIALPIFLGQVNKAREVEAIQTVRQLNEGQKAFYLEKSQFTASMSDLGVALKSPQSASCILGILGIAYQQTQNYCYGIKTLAGSQGPIAFQIALSKKANLASLVGVVYLESTDLSGCGPIKVPGCSAVSLGKCIDLLFKAKANPMLVCSTLK